MIKLESCPSTKRMYPCTRACACACACALTSGDIGFAQGAQRMSPRVGGSGRGRAAMHPGVVRGTRGGRPVSGSRRAGGSG